MSILKQYLHQLIANLQLNRDVGSAQRSTDALLDLINDRYGETFTLLEEYDKGTPRATELLDKPSRVRDILRKS